MALINVGMLLLVAVLVGWIPVLGPLLIGWLAGRAAPGARGVLYVLPALAAQTLGLLAVRWLAQTVNSSGLEGGLWTAVAWFGSPLSAAVSRPLGELISASTVAGFVAVYTLPVLPGLLLGSVTAGTRRRL
ncbi:hypothetical protein [uncultured Deinococcus sp.]|uniref:hypothetical protein n=1 Tax=uncultured Deinococcus sp. TaxID=158789 RepID=UPI0025E9C7D1|nr:hypothetical protein [uncultured Deinococcus sp.]